MAEVPQLPDVRLQGRRMLAHAVQVVYLSI
jgi:hypothetical protein